MSIFKQFPEFIHSPVKQKSKFSMQNLNDEHYNKRHNANRRAFFRFKFPFIEFQRLLNKQTTSIEMNGVEFQ